MDRTPASPPVVTRAHSFARKFFDVRVTRLDDGVMVFHAFPLDEDSANWLVGLFPRSNSRGSQYIVEVKEIP